jgi:hypothetical protein
MANWVFRFFVFFALSLALAQLNKLQIVGDFGAIALGALLFAAVAKLTQ